MAANAVTAADAVYQCKSCERDLGANDFYVSNQARCKECVKERVRANRGDKSDYYREYDKKRYQDDPRVKARHARYRTSDAGKAAFARARAKWQANNPEKRAAHVKFGNAIRDGKVAQESQCRLCGVDGEPLDAHHFDYSKPLDVTWLCKICHMGFHQHQDAMKMAAE